MILFPIYAVVIWYLCFRWRRHWIGWACLVLGLAGVGLLGWAHRMLNTAIFADEVNPLLFQILLVAEAALVLVMGGFSVTLPVEVADVPCRRCRYDLAGLEVDNPTCPECGMQHAARKVRRRACRVCSAEMFVGSGENPQCPACGVEHAIWEVRPPRPAVIMPALRDALRALLHQPRTSRYSKPSSSTPSGIPRIVVKRKPDSTFVSIG
jgi:RNA polymerase subunit RPABC4/transcription elongation factor Spt4